MIQQTHHEDHDRTEQRRLHQIAQYIGKDAQIQKRGNKGQQHPADDKEADEVCDAGFAREEPDGKKDRGYEEDVQRIAEGSIIAQTLADQAKRILRRGTGRKFIYRKQHDRSPKIVYKKIISYYKNYRKSFSKKRMRRVKSRPV